MVLDFDLYRKFLTWEASAIAPMAMIDHLVKGMCTPKVSQTNDDRHYHREENQPGLLQDQPEAEE